MDRYVQRKKRGWIEDSDLIAYRDTTINELLSLLVNENAGKRSIAAKLLPLTCEVTDILLNSLEKEPALYTRLAITDKLENGNPTTALKMIDYLAVIGKNQHQFPVSPSKKKGFPLPRDLIARSLGRMDSEIFPTLLDSAEKLPISKLSELIDAIGYMVFYDPALATLENYQRLLQIKKAHTTEILIQWKFLICFSAFPQSKELLLKEEQFVEESQRSLRIIAAKKD